MRYETYRDFVRNLSKPGSVIAEELTPEDCHKLHMAVGISGEAGELLDAVKKSTIYRKPLDIANIREECGDLLFYITGILDSIGTDMDSVIAENVAKLSLRYRSLNYTNADAIARLDKLETLDKGHGDEVKQPEPDDDFNEVIPRACNLDDEECESCQ